jgi:hypothetical protein
MMFSRREIQSADIACDLYCKLGRPLTVRDCTVVEFPKVTCWADVVGKSAAVVKDPVVASNARKIPANPSNGFVGNNNRTKRMSVLKRSFSENNPVNSIEV